MAIIAKLGLTPRTDIPLVLTPTLRFRSNCFNEISSRLTCPCNRLIRKASMAADKASLIEAPATFHEDGLRHDEMIFISDIDQNSVGNWADTEQPSSTTHQTAVIIGCCAFNASRAIHRFRWCRSLSGAAERVCRLVEKARRPRNTIENLCGP